MYDVVNMPDLVVRYFSSTPWLIAFIVSTVYIFFRMNSARKRSMLVVTIVFFLFINAFVIKVFTRLGQNSTYYRHLWAIPSIAIVGLATIDLIRVIPKWYVKVSVIAALAIGLWFINGQEYIRCRIQIFTTDGTLVPQDVSTFGDKLETLRKESGKNVLFVVCPNGYERPYENMVSELGLYSGGLIVLDSSILNDENHNGEIELTGENPDVEYIMSACCQKGVDYVIVKSNANNEKAFKASAYEPIINGERFLLYRCQGFDGYKRDMNIWGLTNMKSWYNKEGEPALNENGYCTVRFEYDKKANIISESYYDVNNNYVDLQGEGLGYARLEKAYTYSGDIEEIRHYDSKGKLCVKTCYGYSIVRYTYQGRLLTSRSYYDENDLLYNFLTPDLNPHAIEQYEYDDHGNCIRFITLDKERKPSASPLGFNETRIEYSEGRAVREYYLDNGREINRKDTGYAEVKREYDINGYLVQESYYDVDGNSVCRDDTGFSKVVYEYDEYGRMIQETYYNNSVLVNRIDLGYAEIRKNYNEYGEETTYYNKDGEIISN